ncbi:MAG: histidine kinase [Lentimicrobium sp.]
MHILLNWLNKFNCIETQVLHRKFHASFAIILMVFLLSGNAEAQLLYQTEKVNADSLLRLLPSVRNAQKAGLLLQLSSLCVLSDTTRCLDYAKQALRVAEDLRDQNLIARSKCAISVAYHFMGNYPRALDYGLDALELTKKMKDPAIHFEAVTAVWFPYAYSGNHDLANKLVREALHTFPETEDPVFNYRIFISGGWALHNSGSSDLAIPYFRRCLRIYEESGKIPLPNHLVNLFQIGNAYMNTGNYDSCLYFFRLGNKLLLQQPGLFKVLPSFVADFNDDIAECYIRKNMPDSAILLINKSLKQFELRGSRDVLDIGLNNLDLGTIYSGKQQLDDAFRCCRIALDCGIWIYENKRVAMDHASSVNYWYNPAQNTPEYNKKTGLGIAVKALHYLYLIKKTEGDHKQALDWLEQYNQKSGLLGAIEKRDAVIHFNTRYETERKEKQILYLSGELEVDASRLWRTRILLFGSLAIAVLTLLSAGLFIRQMKFRQQQQNNLLQQRLFRAQLNPHFIFNALSNIQGLILENDSIQASTYLSRLSKLVRNILQGSLKEYIPLSQEIENIEHYVELQIIRFSGMFDYELHADNRLEPDTIMIPPMLIQPFVENAIEHGLRYKDSKGKLTVHFTEKHPFVEIVITDDGVGRKKAAELSGERQKYRTSFATQTIQQRIQSLNRLSRRKYSLEITDLTNQDGSAAGTRVQITMPIVST